MADRNRAREVPASRIARLHRLGALTGGIAGRLVVDGVRRLSRGDAPDLRGLLLTPANARQIADDLSRMRGATMKLGQLLSIEASDMLPPELAAILSRLRAGADPMPVQQLKTVLRDAWGRDWRRDFRGFDTRPIAAASIGQVHRAHLRDGRAIAVKVQYPGIAGSIDSDVANLGMLVRLSGLLPRDFALEPYLAEVRAQLHLEADYEQEARAMAAYADLLAGSADFLLPEVVPEWSTRSVLAMSYLSFQPIEALENAPQADRDRTIHRLTGLFLDEVFTFRTVQTDPNFANFGHCPATGRIVLVDFGATRQVDPCLAGDLRNLLDAGLVGDWQAFEAAAGALGLLSPTTPEMFRAALLEMAGMVFDALRRDEFDFATTDLLARLRDVGRRLAAARIAPPEVPVDLLYLQRKAGGLFLLGHRLRARVRIFELLAPYLSPSPIAGSAGRPGPNCRNSRS